jgi:hypothetical protein
MEELSETYPPQVILAVFRKWNKEQHGITCGEEDCINYFNTKNFVELSFNREDLIYDGIIECVDYNKEIPFQSKISPVIMYRFKNRDFCVKHNGIEKFQNLWRKFHYKIMPRYKNLCNLQYRSIYGKFRIS